jgi:hypothetical protein
MLNQAFMFERHEGLAHRRSRDLVARGQGCLQQPLVEGEDANQDVIAQTQIQIRRPGLGAAPST